jgi:hypothetical protein
LASEESTRFKHPVYLSEEEICNLLEKNYFKKFTNDRNYHRERKIGSIKPDFLFFPSLKSIIICEVKITATIDSVRQLLFYRNVVAANLSEANFEQQTEPDIDLILIARNFDVGIAEMLDAFNIDTFRVIVNNDKTIELNINEKLELPKYKIDNFFVNDLRKIYFGGSNG